MKICLIAKYPPIQGGVSSLCYWTARALGNQGHTVHVVTNAIEVEEDFREVMTGSDLDFYQPPGVMVHNTNPFLNPHFIPYANPYTAKLGNTAIEVIREHEVDIIDSWYLVPYSVAGFLAKSLTGKPQIIRHAASDIDKLLSSPDLHHLLADLLCSAEAVLTYPRYKKALSNLGISEERTFLHVDSIDTTVFHPQGEQFDLSPFMDEGVPVITFMGKQGANKGIYELIAALDGLSEDFRFLVITGQNGIETLQRYLDGTRLVEKTHFLNFMPPWRIPSLMRASTCVVHPERAFGVKAHSPRLPREVMATGTCLVLSRELYDKLLFTGMKDGESVIVVDPKDIETFRQKLRQIILNPTHAADIGHAARKVAEQHEDFSSYLDILETLYTAIKG